MKMISWRKMNPQKSSVQMLGTAIKEKKKRALVINPLKSLLTRAVKKKRVDNQNRSNPRKVSRKRRKVAKRKRRAMRMTRPKRTRTQPKKRVATMNNKHK